MLLQRNALKLYINGWISRILKQPLTITFFVTSRCNARCPFCFYTKPHKDELNIQEIKSIAKSIGKFSYLNISGGEPFLRKDLGDICKTFCEESEILYLNIPTNGTLTESIKRQTEFILKNCPKTLVGIMLTILGLPEEHNRILGIKGAFNKLLETYSYLEALRNKYGNLILNINFTFSYHNQNTLYETYQRMSEQFNPNNFTITLVRGDTRDNISSRIDINKYKRLAFAIDRDEYNRATSVFSKIMVARRALMHRINTDIYLNHRQIIPCFAGYMSAVITETGDVYPCELLNMKLGSLRETQYDFNRIWLSRAMFKTRKWITDNHCFCTHECNLPINITYSARGQFLWIKELLKR